MSTGEGLGMLFLKKMTGIGKCCEDCGSKENIEIVQLGGYAGPRHKMLCRSCAFRAKLFDSSVTY